jgi:hypothetical protein
MHRPRPVRQTQARCRTRRKVLHQHVGTLQQTQQYLGRTRMLQIQRQALLAAVGPDEVRAQALHSLVIAAREVTAPGALDLDDACALVGELAGAEGRGDGMLERDDGDAFERQGLGHDV